MATPKQFSFTFQELATILSKEAGVREGHWGIHVQFGLKATNIGASDKDLRPAAVIPIIEIGLQRFESPNNMTVDAAELSANKAASPRSRGASRAARRKNTRS